MRTLQLLFAFLFFALWRLDAQEQDTADYYSHDFIRYEDYTYSPNIKTVILEQYETELTSPVIELNSSQKLHLQFDDLDADLKSFFYTFIYCNAQWQPSLSASKYLTGFTEEKITGYRASFNTLVPYMHYSLVFPSDFMKPLLSGNYIIRVYDESQPSKQVITRKFLIADKKVEINAVVHKATPVQMRNSSQEIDFSISYSNYAISNPFGDVTVVILQNGRWDNAIKNLKPLFLKDKLLDYSYDEENVFNGGNEFRNFDTRSLRFQTERVKSISPPAPLHPDSNQGRWEEKNGNGYDVFLFSDESRSHRRYAFDNDINGRYLIRAYDAGNSALGADYVNVYFSFPVKDALRDANVYVFGAMTDWAVRKENMMTYNEANSTYEAKLFLKQGYYNYQYVLVNDSVNVADETFFEGNHFETENEYFILVYHRNLMHGSDELIGIKKLSSSDMN